ncbi:hypothetical protein [Mongoliitalea lutea]|uniref:Uncharacterized protein n=1 Tax=Mongoliitalea lutea TaxID=849756 RepID=A0A8J3G6R2_9BACT|nr:hypothetical protein [Mongoliitalea lutea]GHB47175.1 hypothetical protein GCM10008106_30150 [Mongoliitalea lutea]
MSEDYSNQKKVEENFSSIFGNKGIFSAVGEKSINNFRAKFVEGQEQQPNLHYFAVGHAFKNIDVKRIFDYQLEEDEKSTIPTKFLKLQSSAFRFGFVDCNMKVTGNKLYILLDQIRNINAHFIHEFELIRKENIEKNIIDFLEESFELALINGIFSKKYGKIKALKNVDFLSNEQKDELLKSILEQLDNEIIKFLKESFYQTLFTQKEEKWKGNKDYKRACKKYLETHLTTKEDWINWILYNNVEDDIEWHLNPGGDDSANNHTHKVLDIRAGEYLSFEGCLFLMSMFLYANEANYLIPKLKGYKKNGKEDSPKLEVFRFFAKKFKSQDIDSENNGLVKFRDMVQYLSKFPVNWNQDLMTDIYYIHDLRTFILEREIENTYILDIENHFSHKLGKSDYDKQKITISEDFVKYAKNYFNPNFKLASNEFEDDFKLVIEKSPEYLSNKRQLDDINIQIEKKKEYNKKSKLQRSKNQIKSKVQDFEKEKENLSSITHKSTIKLKERLENNLLFISNGRNNDRFMDFAARYLAEVNYFGEDAEFKMYENYYTEQELDALKRKEEELSNKEFEKLLYHNGKLVHFTTYKQHLKKYPDWDTPFVVQNNAIFVKINGLDYERGSAFCIQRDLLNYLLEHALTLENAENKGKELLLAFQQEKEIKLDNAKIQLSQGGSISAIEKKAFKKILPRRLIHQHCPPEKRTLEELTSLEKILEDAKNAQAIFDAQLEQATKENRKDLFLKKNKGKQFKLKFIFKAWQLMFFREQYETNKQAKAILEKPSQKNRSHEIGHHKSLNITRDEYNDFSKWLFAMDEVPQYKKQLGILLESKGVLQNPELNKIFATDHSNKYASINDVFNETIGLYERWLKSNTEYTKTNSYSLANYSKMMEVGNIHINLSHFIAFAENRGVVLKKNGKIIRPLTRNSRYLFNTFYGIEVDNQNFKKLEKKQQKLVFVLRKKLWKNHLEDCLLYEVALRYFTDDKALRAKSYNNLATLLVQDVSIPVKNAKWLDRHGNEKIGSYQVIVPFKDLEKFAQIQYFDKSLRQYSLLKNLPVYLSKVKTNEEKVMQLRDMENAYKRNRAITLSHFSLLHNHLITQQGRFTFCIMAMEEYFIWKHRFSIEQQSDTFKPKNRIVINEIPTLESYFVGSKIRNTAFHFNLPLEETYKQAFLKIEEQFIASEVKANNYKTLDNCPSMLKRTIKSFIGQMHEEAKMNFHPKMTDKQKVIERKKAEDKMFEDLIK